MADSMGMAFSIQGLLQCLLTVNKLLSSVTLIVSKCDRNFTSFRMPGKYHLTAKTYSSTTA